MLPSPCRVGAPVQATKLVIEIEPHLSGSEETGCESRPTEPRSRSLKFADLALHQEGRRPSRNDVTEIMALSRTEQRAIRSRIRGSETSFEKRAASQSSVKSSARPYCRWAIWRSSGVICLQSTSRSRCTRAFPGS